ncbi:hypothetical protein BLL42_06570 [Pseudomonas frederiksbergensis]|uniref:Uncharacterized protein n=1 Tax=Pseudomonas frederiksbergensis TaxID=104087 RepID=A0A1J0EH90_9PSED|nr:hypothetical protein BLL42_06570 [Pseudomonas frederiksbergensis]
MASVATPVFFVWRNRKIAGFDSSYGLARCQQGLSKAAIFGVGRCLPAALLTPTLLIVSPDWHGLQRWFDQTKRDTEVMEPVLQFLFHGAPLQGSAERPGSIDASYR